MSEERKYLKNKNALSNIISYRKEGSDKARHRLYN